MCHWHGYIVKNNPLTTDAYFKCFIHDLRKPKKPLFLKSLPYCSFRDIYIVIFSPPPFLIFYPSSHPLRSKFFLHNIYLCVYYNLFAESPLSPYLLCTESILYYAFMLDKLDARTSFVRFLHPSSSFIKQKERTSQWD